MCDLQNPIFKSETKARQHLEKLLWPDGPVCPHCKSKDRITKIKGKAARPGLYRCNSCRKQFTVTVGTVFERSKIPLTKWLLGFHLMAASKKGISAHQLHRMLGVTYKTAWFMCHRIREAMKPGSNEPPFGGEGEVVEADETYIGKAKESRYTYTLLPGKGWVRRGPGRAARNIVLTLVERGGRARSVHVRTLTTNSVQDIILRNTDRKSKLLTDEAKIYKPIGKQFSDHASVNHSKFEWGRGPEHTNTIEGFFSIFKRGMRGVYQHCSEAHLQRYLHEFDFRYSNRKISDSKRAEKALEGIVGRRLTYQQPR